MNPQEVAYLEFMNAVKESEFLAGIQAVVNLLAEAEQEEAIRWIKEQYLKDKLESYRGVRS